MKRNSLIFGAGFAVMASAGLAMASETAAPVNDLA